MVIEPTSYSPNIKYRAPSAYHSGSDPFIMRLFLRPAASLLLVHLLFLSVPAHARQFQAASPESVGMSSERLSRLDDVMQRYVDEQFLAGSVTLVLKNGKIVYHKAMGMRDVEIGDPMEVDDLFRIASQTKAIVTLAVLILQEQGKLSIREPVGTYLPEWQHTTVAVANEDGYDVVPADRAITIRDLMTHRAGVGWGSQVARAEWEAADLMYWYLADREEGIQGIVRTIASLPMDAQPGERYVYGLGIDVLGALIEVVSGKPLDEFLDEHLFIPLGMVDTHFFVPPEKSDRLAVVYGGTEQGLVRLSTEGHYEGQGHYVDGPRATFGGGAGLVSTAHDYARFLQMVVNGGELDGKRILSPTTVDLVLSNHIGESNLGAGRKMGLGFELITDLGAYGLPGAEGQFSWGGAYHTTYFASPRDNMVVVYLTQIMNAKPGLTDHNRLRALTYQAIVN